MMMPSVRGELLRNIVQGLGNDVDHLMRSWSTLRNWIKYFFLLRSQGMRETNNLLILFCQYMCDPKTMNCDFVMDQVHMIISCYSF